MKIPKEVQEAIKKKEKETKIDNTKSFEQKMKEYEQLWKEFYEIYAEINQLVDSYLEKRKEKHGE